MVNVVCVKYGNKYDSSQVNILYEMVRRNISLPFSFSCFTDDSSGLDDNIIPIKLDLDLDLNSFWWKIEMFNSKKYVNHGPTLFLDLDVIIQRNIDYLFELVEEGKIITTDTGIIEHEDDAYPYETFLNSSIVIFNSNQVDYIFEHFISDSDYFILKYRGLCRYLSHEHTNNIQIKLKPHIHFYSFLGRGNNISSDSVDKYRIYGKYKHFYNPDATICLLNGTSNNKNVVRYAMDFFSNYYK